MSGDHPVRIRVHVAGVLVDEQTMDADAPQGVIEELGVAHGCAVQLAEAANAKWLIEFRFWDGEHVRFGTDPAGCVEPIEVSLPRLMAHLGGQGPIPETP